MKNKIKKKFNYETHRLTQWVEQKNKLQFVFLDGQILVDSLQWHTDKAFGLTSNKIIYKQAIKYIDVAPLD